MSAQVTGPNCDPKFHSDLVLIRRCHIMEESDSLVKQLVFNYLVVFLLYSKYSNEYFREKVKVSLCFEQEDGSLSQEEHIIMPWNNTKYNVPSTTGATFSASSETLPQFDAEGNKVYRPITGLPGKEPAILKNVALSPLSASYSGNWTESPHGWFPGLRWFQDGGTSKVNIVSVFFVTIHNFILTKRQ